jgi:hypothetical protein
MKDPEPINQSDSTEHPDDQKEESTQDLRSELVKQLAANAMVTYREALEKLKDS